jgi:hypothetical protein
MTQLGHPVAETLAATCKRLIRMSFVTSDQPRTLEVADQLDPPRWVFTGKQECAKHGRLGCCGHGGDVSRNEMLHSLSASGFLFTPLGFSVRARGNRGISAGQASPFAVYQEYIQLVGR